MSNRSKWLLIVFLTLILHVAFATVIGTSEGRTIFPFTRVVGSYWSWYAFSELQLASISLVLFTGSLLFERRSGDR
ncbi:MAG: hypothetical protein JWN15_1937 [Firmicutes bacterium]|nr:hypothetical protein [Bacillota bacterium]